MRKLIIEEVMVREIGEREIGQVTVLVRSDVDYDNGLDLGCMIGGGRRLVIRGWCGSGSYGGKSHYRRVSDEAQVACVLIWLLRMQRPWVLIEVWSMLAQVQSLKKSFWTWNGYCAIALLSSFEVFAHLAIFLIQRNRHDLIGRAMDDNDTKRVLQFLKNDPIQFAQDFSLIL
ncbi:hypothetical protein LguiB_014063 [Lonicera macranthoides]